MRGVGPGATCLVARPGKAGFASVVLPIDLPESGVAEVQIVLERGETIEGVVLRPDGSPAEEAYESWSFAAEGGIFHGGYARAALDGRFALENVAVCAVQLTCTHFDTERFTWSLTLHPPFDPVTATLAPAAGGR